MAFAVVLHLDPNAASSASEVLDRATELPVVTATDGTVVRPNRVYAIPSGTQMRIEQGRLRLAPRERRYANTIDTFFESLAADCGSRAIAVVLSGSNSDGSSGTRAVREAGGIAFAQEPASTEFSEMPRAAIDTGQVDFILTPAQIAAELVHISEHPYIREQPPAESGALPTQFSKANLAIVHRLLQRAHSVDFSNYKQATFERRLRRRLALTKHASLNDYVQFLRDTPAELDALYRDALIAVTEFFRDPEAFATLRDRFFPILLAQPSAASTVRIWVPGCASGEEVYSIAICLLESLDSLLINPAIHIFGTDVSEEAIEAARNGFYRASQMENVSIGRRQRFFSEVEGGHQLNKSVRELCVFARQDLGSDPPFSDLDLVSCRNVLIYFKSPLQRRVLSIFHYSLKAEGFLMLGGSESAAGAPGLFEIRDERARIYQRRQGPSRICFDFVTSTSLSATPRTPSVTDLAVPRTRPDLGQWADRIMLNRYAPVGVVVNEGLEILEFRGDTSAYLRPPQGEPNFNLPRMLRPSLLAEVRLAFERAKQQDELVRRDDLPLDGPPPGNVSVEIVPFEIGSQRYFLVLFDTMPGLAAEPAVIEPAESEPAESEPAELEPPVPSEISRLERELAAARRELLDTQTFLQVTAEEQEATHQQLIAANEEVLSSNEELKSINEELQTAKEEIQSANEELKTTNEELQNRNAESRRANDDLINLIDNVSIPIVMLSEDLRIRSFTPSARDIFSLIPTDIGRPIADIRSTLDPFDLDAIVRDVIANLDPVEREVQTRDGRWYLLRIRPYRTVDNQINGAVVAFVDIDNLRRTEQELRDSRTQLERELRATSHMQSLSLQLFASLDLDRALHEVLIAAIAIHQTDLGLVQLYDADCEELRVEASCGFAPEVLAEFATIETSERAALVQFFSSSRRLAIADLANDDAPDTPDTTPYRQLAAAGAQSLQVTPLRSRNGPLLGVLSTYLCDSNPFNTRELRLLDLYARQASGFIDLIRAETERQRLQEREQAARAANASKDEFLSVLSHELRTPLNSILGWAQLLQRGTLDLAGTDRAIASIRRSAEAQLGLIEELLDTTRIVEGRFAIVPRPTDFTDLVEQAIAAIQPQAHEKQLQLDADLAAGPLLELDPSRMMQVVANLLANAVKFTPDGGRIAIRLTYREASVELEVSDTGCGIAADLMPHIFDRFRQADASNTGRESGLGLGLFLARSIVRAHDGTIAVASDGENCGTTFTVTLPQVPISAPPEPAPLPSAPELGSLRVLLVDDAESNLALLEAALEDLATEVLSARTAAEALDVVVRGPLDLIISDLGLPDRNGYELIREIRSLPPERGGQLPAIAVTGYASEQDVRAAIAAGFQLHLAKPVDLDELFAAVQRLVARPASDS